MAANIALTKTFARINAIVTAYTGIGAGRLLKGYKRFTDTENFYALVRALVTDTQGYYWSAIRNIGSAGPLQKTVWKFDGMLWMPLPKDTSSDLTVAWEYAMGLQAALETDSSYGDGEHVPHVSISAAPPEVLQKLGVLIFDFGSGEFGGSMEVIDP